MWEGKECQDERVFDSNYGKVQGMCVDMACQEETVESIDIAMSTDN